MAAKGPTSDLKVIVVDIDRASIVRVGHLAVAAETMARIVEAGGDRAPAAIAIDVLFAEARRPLASSTRAPRLDQGDLAARDQYAGRKPAGW